MLRAEEVVLRREHPRPLRQQVDKFGGRRQVLVVPLLKLIRKRLPDAVLRLILSVLPYLPKLVFSRERLRLLGLAILLAYLSHGEALPGLPQSFAAGLGGGALRARGYCRVRPCHHLAGALSHAPRDVLHVVRCADRYCPAHERTLSRRVASLRAGIKASRARSVSGRRARGFPAPSG